MSKFKIGDRVRALYSCYGQFTAGREYVVSGINDYSISIAEDDAGSTENGWAPSNFELVTPAFTLTTGKFYRTASGSVTGRVSKGDTGFEAVVDGKVRIFDAAGGAVFGGDDIVEEWVPRVGDRVVEAEPKQYDFIGHWRDFWQSGEGTLTDSAFVVTKVNGKHVHYSNRVGGRGPQATIDCFEPLPVVASAQPEATLKIETGRYYRTRDGRKVGPMKVWGFGGWHSDESAAPLNGGLWFDSGEPKYPGAKDSPQLIAEWQDTPSAPVSAQVDAIAEEYGPVVVSDNAQSAITVSISLDTGNMHEELDELIAKLKKVRKLQRQVGLAA